MCFHPSAYALARQREAERDSDGRCQAILGLGQIVLFGRVRVPVVDCVWHLVEVSLQFLGDPAAQVLVRVHVLRHALFEREIDRRGRGVGIRVAFGKENANLDAVCLHVLSQIEKLAGNSCECPADKHAQRKREDDALSVLKPARNFVSRPVMLCGISPARGAVASARGALPLLWVFPDAAPHLMTPRHWSPYRTSPSHFLSHLTISLPIG